MRPQKVPLVVQLPLQTQSEILISTLNSCQKLRFVMRMLNRLAEPIPRLLLQRVEALVNTQAMFSVSHISYDRTNHLRVALQRFKSVVACQY